MVQKWSTSVLQRENDQLLDAIDIIRPLTLEVNPRDQAAGKLLLFPSRSSARRSLRMPFERRALRGKLSHCAPEVAAF